MTPRLRPALALLGLLSACEAAPGPRPAVVAAPSASPAMPAAPSGAVIGSVAGRAAPGGRLIAPDPRPLEAQPPAANFRNAPENGFQSVAEAPVSTFSLHSDTASYAIARRLLLEGRRPPPEAIRAEEFINAFPYDYPLPASRAEPFAPFISVHPSPWNPERRLLHIGLRTYAPAATPRVNLTLLVDVSGSMAPPDRLPLVVEAMRSLTRRLNPTDQVSIVTYAGKTAVTLPPTPAGNQAAIEAALSTLQADGGTSGGAGLALAYDQAAKAFDRNAVNRVVLATDGDFNLGPTSAPALEGLIRERRRAGIYLTTLGVGLDNLSDDRMSTIARAGNGIYVYAATPEDARRALVEDFAQNLLPVADDVKAQVEFNPAQVSGYRLIGYETRLLRREDFRDDTVDAGEIGSNRAVTALYEFIPRGAAPAVDPLRYAPAAPGAAPPPNRGAEFAFLRLRYKRPGESTSRELVRAITPRDSHPTFDAAPADARFAAAVAGFAQHLRNSPQVRSWPLEEMAATASAALGRDVDGRRAEFVALVRRVSRGSALSMLH
ncbi:YfbK domain-containing protein [Muricoccus radiodurans]|uniref:vWA domain-containing protein n=1 Tax=Muricoccus radiodurans TaxID=2231721 RepID=UPI003CFAC97B